MLGLWIQAWRWRGRRNNPYPIQLLRHQSSFQLEVQQLCIPLLPTLETMRWVVLVRGFMVVNIFHFIKVQSHLLAPVQSHTGHDSICNFEMSSSGQRVGSWCFVVIYVLHYSLCRFVLCCVKKMLYFGPVWSNRVNFFSFLIKGGNFIQ